MVDIKAALKKARGTGRAATPRGRAVVEVHSFDDKANTATGKIVDGLAAGEIITFEISGKNTIADYTKKSKTKVELPNGDKPGGTLQVEGLQKVDGKDVYKTRWVKTFQSKPGADSQHMLNGMTFALKPLNRKDSNGVQVANLDVLDMAGETHAKSLDELRAAFKAAVDKDGGVTIMAVTPEGDPLVQTYYGKAEKREDGTYVRETGESRLEVLEKRLAENVGHPFDEIFGPLVEGAGVSVVPTKSTRIGSGTWQAVQEKVEEAGRGGPVDPSTFQFTKLPGRFAGAVARLEVEADRKAVIDAFLNEANEDAKARFHEKGFGAVEERDIQSFLDKRGVKLIALAEDAQGYISGSILTMPYDANDLDKGAFVTKTFNTTAATPLPPVKAFEEVRKAYYEEVVKAAKAIAELELNGAKKNAGTPAAATTAPAAAEAAPAENLGADEIDDLLGSIADESIDP